MMPAGFGFGAKLFEYGLQLFHLRAGKLRFQFGPAGGERQLAHAAVVCGGIHRDQFHFNQLPQGCVQRLFADTEQAEQGIDRNLRIAPDEIQDAVMHASQSALVEDAVRRRGEGAVAEIELLDGQAQRGFAWHGGKGVGAGYWVKHVDMIGARSLDCL